MTIINPLIIPPAGGRAYNHITPFTYRDGLTYVEVLEKLRGYIRDVIVPSVDDIGEFVLENITAALSDIESKLEIQSDKVDDEILELVDYVNNSVESIINNSVELQGEVIAQLLVLSVRSYGAVGDNVADDAPAIQAAIDDCFSRGGGTVFMPIGTYRIGATLTMRSGVNLVGSGAGTVLTTSGLSRLINGAGSEDVSTRLAATITSGQVNVQTAVGHGLSVGDVCLLMSQRNAMSPGAGEEWRMGTAGSGGLVYAYFGEFVTIRSVGSVNTAVLAGPVIYPDYRPDDTQETSQHARPAADIRKINFIENLTVGDFDIRGSVTGTELIEFSLARNVTVKNITWNGASDSTMLKFRASYQCEGFSLKTRYPYTTVPPQIYSRNAYITTSSQSCGFIKCDTDNSTQGFDVSVSNGGILNTFTFIRECESTNSTVDGMTIHAGAYAATVENCSVTGCNGGGITTRSRSSMIVGNIITGSGAEDTTPTGRSGIHIFEAFTRDVLVAENRVTGFTNAVRIYSPQSIGSDFTWIGARIIDNIFIDYNVGVLVQKYGRTNVQSGIVIEGNTFRRPFISPVKGLAWAVIIPAFIVGARVVNNGIYGVTAGIADGGIKFEANSTSFYIVGNTIVSHGTTPFLVEKPTDPTYLSDLIARGHIAGNVVTGGAAQVFDASSDIANSSFFNEAPYNDNMYSLGNNSRRYTTVWTQSGVIVKSSNGTSYRLGVTNAGELSIATV